MPTIPSILLSVLLAAGPPKPPDVTFDILYDCPFGWAGILCADGTEAIIVSPTHSSVDPVFCEAVMWSEQDSAPTPPLSPLQACFAACKDACAPWGIKTVKFTAGEKPVCDCTCNAAPPTPTKPAPNEEA